MAGSQCPTCLSKEFTCLQKFTQHASYIKQTSRSNIIPRPSASEYASLSSVIEEAEDELCLSETLIAHLTKERSKLQSHVRDARSLSSPIRKLPAELLAEVFQHLQFKANITCRIDKCRVTAPVFTVAQVCAYWREVAIGTKALWATLNVTVCYVPNPVSLVPLLDNCRGFPLDLTLDLGHVWSSPSPSRTNYLNLVKELTDVSDSWKRLSVVLGDQLESLVPIEDRLPQLQSLELDLRQRHKFTTFTLFRSCYSLTSLDLLLEDPPDRSDEWYGNNNPYKDLPVLPWSQLTTLRMGTQHIDQFYLALSLCTNVVDVTYLICGEDWPDWVVEPHSRAPQEIVSPAQRLVLNIGTYYMGFPDPLLPNVLFKRVDFPCLTELTMGLADEDSWIITNHVDGNFLRRCDVNTRLTSLSILKVTLQFPALKSMLGILPNLTQLVIHDHQSDAGELDESEMVTDELMEYLDADPLTYWPHLQHLELATWGNFLSEDKFLSMVNRRCGPWNRGANQLRRGDFLSDNVLGFDGGSHTSATVDDSVPMCQPVAQLRFLKLDFYIERSEDVGLYLEERASIIKGLNYLQSMGVDLDFTCSCVTVDVQ
jgi:hypothetical protein